MAYGDPYPGIYQTPAWWNVSTATTANVTVWPQQYVPRLVQGSPSPAVAPEPVDDSNVGWLRRRVEEMCDHAELAVA